MNEKKSLGLLGRIGLALAATLHASSLLAQAFPAAKPITYIYPYAAGSSPDSVARAIGQEAGKRIGQTILHENRPGAGGRIGFEALMRAPADGYTVGMFTNGLGVYQPLIESKLYVEPGKDYTPVVWTIDSPQVLAIRPNAPFRDIKGLIAYAKANPGKLNGSSPGLGTGGHLGVVLMALAVGADITHVPYKGTAPAITAVMSGEVDMTLTDSGAKPLIDAGKLLGIGHGAEQRWSYFPDMPTFGEAGLIGVRMVTWLGIVAPPNMPRDVLLRLNRAYNEAINSPEVRAKIEGLGQLVKGGTPEEFAAVIRGDLKTFGPVIRSANIKLE